LYECTETGIWTKRRIGKAAIRNVKKYMHRDLFHSKEEMSDSVHLFSFHYIAPYAIHNASSWSLGRSTPLAEL
jgi:hypothetical protein